MDAGIDRGADVASVLLDFVTVMGEPETSRRIVDQQFQAIDAAPVTAGEGVDITGMVLGAAMLVDFLLDKLAAETDAPREALIVDLREHIALLRVINQRGR